ncbi:hypothetical protein [Ensifer sp. B1-9]|uniref:hypothetical protein n=1 Tax=Ensifer sp. B1-9 TaxID=3141455 RepID=UPI003D206AED
MTTMLHPVSTESNRTDITDRPAKLNGFGIAASTCVLSSRHYSGTIAHGSEVHRRSAAFCRSAVTALSLYARCTGVMAIIGSMPAVPANAGRELE